MTPARRRVLVGAGVCLVLVGAVLVGRTFWDRTVTDVVAEHRRAQVVDEVREAWRHPAVADPVVAVDEVPAGASALVRIPRFGSDYVVPVLEGAGPAELAVGLGHLAGTAGPGARGNYALAGHRVTWGEPLRDLPLLRPGDRVLVETRDRTWTYAIDTDPASLVVDRTATWVADDRPVNPDPAGVQAPERGRLLTLVTCAALVHTDERMVVFGHLVSSAAR